MKPYLPLLFSLLCVLSPATTSCSALYDFEEIHPTGNPQTYLDEILEDWEELLVDNPELLRTRLSNLSTSFPNHVPTMYANGRLAFLTGRQDEAQRWFDAVLTRDAKNASAAAMRARIALQEGNSQYAEQLLKNSIRLVPDSSVLHESLAAVYFSSYEFAKARAEIDLAENLGAPTWRTAFHRGLILEMQDNEMAAAMWYEAALRQRPDFPEATQRLAGMLAID